MIVAYVSKSHRLALEQESLPHIEVSRFTDLGQFIDFYDQTKNREVSLVYEVEGAEELGLLRNLHFKQNIFVAILGPADPALSLLAGKLGADSYLFQPEVSPRQLLEQLIDSRKNLKERAGTNHLSAFTGVHGGIGTTTLAIHAAKMLADSHPERKVLFLDFTHTKAVSNLFFDLPNPQYTIGNVAVTDYSHPEVLPQILHRVSKNLYFVPGIQRHADRRELEEDGNVQRILAFLEGAKQFFNDIILDLGVFEDVLLKNRVSEVADALFVVAEFSIPSIAILKSQLDVFYRLGWAPKTHIVVNRYDAQGTFDVNEARKIIREDEPYPYRFDFMLPNDSKNLRQAWNEASLLTDSAPNTAFVKSVREFVEAFFGGETAAARDIPSQERPPHLGQRLLEALRGGNSRRSW
jgi:pilus assembly protein CpaE